MSGEGTAGGGRLEFDAWAVLSARRLRRDDAERAAILERAGVDARRWDDSDAHWSGVMRAELDAGETARARQLGAACAAEIEGRRRARPAAPPAEIEGDAPAQEQASDEPARVEVAVPSFMLRRDAPPPSIPGGAPPPSVSGIAPPPSVREMMAPPSGRAGMSPPSARPSAASRATQAMPAVGAPSKALPFARREVLIGGFDVQQYASLCAEIAASPARSGEILARYGLKDDEARKKLADQWTKRLERDQELLALLQDLINRYRHWLWKQKR